MQLLETSNLFEILSVEDNFEEDGSMGHKLIKVRTKTLKASSKCKKKTVKYSKKDFSNEKNVPKESMSSDIEEDNTNIFEIRYSKKCLKKCRFCNFKKRSCILNSVSCKAKTLKCHTCSKYGHFPQSMDCKAKKLKRKMKRAKNIDNHRIKTSYDVQTSIRDNNKCIKQVGPLVCWNRSSIFKAESYSPLDSISQLDGNDSISSTDEREPCKGVFAIKCELKEIINLVSFFRSMNVLWISSREHLLCKLDEKCFLCNMRSSCLRIRQERKTGPKSLKLNEFTCQLDQYGSQWRLLICDMNEFIKATVNLLLKSDPSMQSKFLMPHVNKNTEDYSTITITTEVDFKSKQMSDIIKSVIQICGSAVDIENKCVIVDFSSPVDLQISSNESYEHQKKKYNVAYKSHIEIGENNDLKTYFRFNNCIFIQVGDSIYPSDFGRHKDVTILSIVISKKRDDLLFENVKDYIYAEKDQVKLRQKRLKNLDPEG